MMNNKLPAAKKRPETSFNKQDIKSAVSSPEELSGSKQMLANIFNQLPGNIPGNIWEALNNLFPEGSLPPPDFRSAGQPVAQAANPQNNKGQPLEKANNQPRSGITFTNKSGEVHKIAKAVKALLPDDLNMTVDQIKKEHSSLIKKLIASASAGKLTQSDRISVAKTVADKIKSTQAKSIPGKPS